MAISTFEIKICGQKLCAQKDGFCKFGHNYTHSDAYTRATYTLREALPLYYC